MKLKDNLLKRVDTMQDYSDTFFYVTLATNPIQYGIAFNIHDKRPMLKTKNSILKERQDQIESWNEEQRLRNLKAQEV